MEQQKKLIPFGFWPGAWGLAGKTREIAKAEYELAGQELDVKIAEIECGIDSINYKKRLINIDLKYNIINEYEAASRLVDIDHETGTVEHALDMVEVDLKFGKIKELEAEKRTATLNNEPWIASSDSQYNKKMGKDGFSFELDWNDQFVEMLMQNGYEGTEPAHIIEQWFDDVANSQLSEVVDDDDDEKDKGPDFTIPRTKTKTKIIKDVKGGEKKEFS